MYLVPLANRSGMLQVSDIHRIYWEESGNPRGIPVIFLHGGPGAGAQAKSRNFFDPTAYRIIIIDQRGCGRSKPFAEVRENTTWDLVADMEKVRMMLGISKWLVFGGSWGSTLALAYAETHPDCVLGLILRGIFLCRRNEIEWINEAGGAGRIYPEQWQRYIAPVAPEKRGDMVAAYHEMLFGEDRETMLRAAKTWADWEGWLVQFEPKLVDGQPEEALAIARIECHYYVNNGWLDGQRAILKNIGKIRHLPAVIVQGRYDMCTPMQSAWDLKQAFPEADLRIVQGGHSAFDKPLADALVRAADEFAARLNRCEGMDYADCSEV